MCSKAAAGDAIGLGPNRMGQNIQHYIYNTCRIKEEDEKFVDVTQKGETSTPMQNKRETKQLGWAVVPTDYESSGNI